MIVVLGLLVALGPLTIDMYLPALPRIADELSVSSSVVQLTLTGTLAGLALGQLIIGPLSDSLGPPQATDGGHRAAHAGVGVLPVRAEHRDAGGGPRLAGGRSGSRDGGRHRDRRRPVRGVGCGDGACPD